MYQKKTKNCALKLTVTRQLIEMTADQNDSESKRQLIETTFDRNDI